MRVAVIVRQAVRHRHTHTDTIPNAQVKRRPHFPLQLLAVALFVYFELAKSFPQQKWGICKNK